MVNNLTFPTASVPVTGLVDSAVAEFPRFKYSMNQVIRAGEALKGKILWSDTWTENEKEAVLEIFRIADNWRNAHLYPMRRLRSEMASKMRSDSLPGITVARLKRMSSIRRKLALRPYKLNQLQDLGGCRAIVPTMEQASALVESFKSKGKHELRDEDDYVASPKAGGYRSRHLIYKFIGEGEAEVHSGRRIELQIRTRLQHSWATAVEAVGLFRNEDLKGGVGDASWLRLFELVSAELAETERCPLPSGIPTRRERVQEIKDLNRALQAAETLENWRQAIRYTDEHLQPSTQPKHYRIEYNNARREVRVKPHYRPLAGVAENDLVEQQEISSGDGSITTVFVEADRIDDLIEAYPNYFGDVHVFINNLRRLADGRAALEYKMAPQDRVPPSTQGGA